MNVFYSLSYQNIWYLIYRSRQKEGFSVSAWKSLCLHYHILIIVFIS